MRSEYLANLALSRDIPSWQEPSTCRRTKPTRSTLRRLLARFFGV